MLILNNILVARGGIEPPTRGFSVRLLIFNLLILLGFNDQATVANVPQCPTDPHKIPTLLF